MATRPDIFIREDLSKPENRINVAIFGMMNVAPFASWLRDRLRLPAGAVLYPPLNTANEAGAGRPDFAVRDAGTDELIAHIEVECHRDEQQIARFRAMFPATPVYAIWGRPGPGCDLSLEEIASFLAGANTWEPAQARIGASHLRALIHDALAGASSSSKKATVGDEMWESAFVAGLRRALGHRIEKELPGMSKQRPGEIRINTTDTADNRGFSLRVFTPKANGRSVSILNRTAGRAEINFSSRAWLAWYLPNASHTVAIGELVALLHELGGDMEQAWRPRVTMPDGRPRANHTTPVPLSVAEGAVDRIAEIVAKLGAIPAR